MILFPSPALIPYISHYLLAELSPGDKTYLPATSSATFVMFIRGGVTIEQQGLNNVDTPSAYIEGPCLVPRSSYAMTNTEIVSIHFRPAMLEHFVTIPVTEFTNNRITLEDLKSDRLKRMVENARQSVDRSALIVGVEQSLIQLLQSRKTLNRRASKTLKLPSNIHLPVKQLANFSGLSVRQLERRFLNSYGVTLRDWRRLDRATKALLSLLLHSEQTNMSAIANHADYFDHAHMCRDFRELCGVAPQQLVGQAENNPAFWPLRELVELFQEQNVASVQAPTITDIRQ